MIKIKDIEKISWYLGNEDLILELTNGDVIHVTCSLIDSVFSLSDEREYEAEKAVCDLVDIFAEAMEYAQAEL